MKYKVFVVSIYIILSIGPLFISFSTNAEDLVRNENTATNLVDPFKSKLPKETPKAGEKPPEERITPPAIVVGGLIVGGPVPMAIIEDKLYKIGDKVQEATITNITKDGVEVLYKWKPFSYPAPFKKLMPIKGGENAK